MVSRSGVRVSGRDEVYGAYKGVSESEPPGGGGALVARRSYVQFPVHLCFAPQLFGGERRRVARYLGYYQIVTDQLAYMETANLIIYDSTVSRRS